MSGVARRNWAGNVHYAARAFHEPTTLDELRRLVAGSDRLRAVGSGHSFTPVCASEDTLVSLAYMRNVLSLDADERVTPELAANAWTAVASAGDRIDASAPPRATHPACAASVCRAHAISPWEQ